MLCCALLRLCYGYAGYRSPAQVFEVQPYIVLEALLKEALAGDESWKVLPGLSIEPARVVLLLHYAVRTVPCSNN
jgi:hypothetical protein